MSEPPVRQLVVDPNKTGIKSVSYDYETGTLTVPPEFERMGREILNNPEFFSSLKLVRDFFSGRPAKKFF